MLKLAENNHSSLSNKTSTPKNYSTDNKKIKIDVEKMIASYRASVMAML